MPKPLAIITAGPASTPIDAVRRITNFATGEIGTHLASNLTLRGFDSILFRGEGSTFSTLPEGVPIRTFTTNEDLAQQLETLSDSHGHNIRAVFHAAALSDYSIAAIHSDNLPIPPASKIPGNLPSLSLTLKPAPKLLPLLRSLFPAALIVGWKYELEGSREDAIMTANAQLHSLATDITIVNGSAYGLGFGILEPQKSPLHCPDKANLSHLLALRAFNFLNNSQ